MLATTAINTRQPSQSQTLASLEQPHHSIPTSTQSQLTRQLTSPQNTHQGPTDDRYHNRFQPYLLPLQETTTTPESNHLSAEEPNEVDPQDLKDATLLSALPLDFSSDRLNDLKASTYFDAISAMIESGVSFDSIKNINPQLNRFLVDIDESQFVDMITGDEFTDPYQAPDGFTYNRDTLEGTIRSKLNPDEGTAMADYSPAQLIASIRIGSSNFFPEDEAQRMADNMSELSIDAKVEQIMHNMNPNHDVWFIINYKQNFDLAKIITTKLERNLTDQEINQTLVDCREQLREISPNSHDAIANLFI